MQYGSNRKKALSDELASLFGSNRTQKEAKPAKKASGKKCTEKSTKAKTSKKAAKK